MGNKSITLTGGPGISLLEEILIRLGNRRTEDKTFIGYSAAWKDGDISKFIDPYTGKPGTGRDFVLHCNSCCTAAACMKDQRNMKSKYKDARENEHLAGAMRYYDEGNEKMVRYLLRCYDTSLAVCV